MPQTHNASVSEYRIEKVRRPLNVLLIDGSRVEGEVFLRPVSRYRSRPEDPVDLLNDAEPFFALVRDGEVLLVAKSSVARAETSVQTEDELEISALGITVEVTMTDGNVCTGSIFLDTRSDRPRLMDFLNGYRDRFIPVVDVRQVFLVNTQMIAHVREVA
jgi:hypothetical protein